MSRRVCHLCAGKPRDFACELCDGAASLAVDHLAVFLAHRDWCKPRGPLKCTCGLAEAMAAAGVQSCGK